MKKCFALLLAAAMLLSLGMIGASATTPEEEALQAQGKALLQGTIDTLASGTYTVEFLRTGFGEKIVLTMDGTHLAYETDMDWNGQYWLLGKISGFFIRLILGTKSRVLFTSTETSLIFPEKNQKMQLNEVASQIIESLGIFLRYNPFAAWPDEMIDECTVTNETLNNKSYLCVTFDDADGNRTKAYYQDGALKYCDTSYELLDIHSLSPTASANMFQTAAAKELSGFQLMLFLFFSMMGGGV